MVAIAEVFSFRDDWHQDNDTNPLVRQYQATLDAVLSERPDLAGCVVHCCHCGIRFLTHPRNAGRQNLGCPFGCQQHHRRQCANERSKKHYRTAEGRRNKKRHNGQRSPASDPPPIPLRGDVSGQHDADGESACPSTPQGIFPEARETSHEDGRLTLDGLMLDESTLVNSPVLPYACMVASLIEGQTIGREELLAALRKSLRQRSMGRRARREYVLRYLNEHPP